MTALVIYDSLYGNTEKIAQAIAQSLGCQAKPVSKVDQKTLASLQLLIVGSPVQGGQATKAMQAFLNTLPPDCLQNVKVAAFDTRFAEKEQSFGLRAIIKLVGFAAPRIARVLEEKGGTVIAQPEGFVVSGKAGPLKEGEIARAREWAQNLLVTAG